MENIFENFNRFAPAPVFMDPINVKDPYTPEPLPPIWLPPDPKYPGPVDNGGIIIAPPFRGYYYSGVVRDAYTELPLPGATVTLMRGKTAIANQVANNNGQFGIDITEPVDTIDITEVSHKSFSWPASEVQKTFDLEPKYVTGPPVVLPPGSKKKTDWWIWAVVAFGVAKWQKLI